MVVQLNQNHAALVQQNRIEYTRIRNGSVGLRHSVTLDISVNLHSLRIKYQYLPRYIYSIDLGNEMTSFPYKIKKNTSFEANVISRFVYEYYFRIHEFDLKIIERFEENSNMKELIYSNINQIIEDGDRVRVNLNQMDVNIQRTQIIDSAFSSICMVMPNNSLKELNFNIQEIISRNVTFSIVSLEQNKFVFFDARNRTDNFSYDQLTSFFQISIPVDLNSDMDFIYHLNDSTLSFINQYCNFFEQISSVKDAILKNFIFQQNPFQFRNLKSLDFLNSLNFDFNNQDGGLFGVLIRALEGKFIAEKKISSQLNFIQDVSSSEACVTVVVTGDDDHVSAQGHIKILVEMSKCGYLIHKLIQFKNEFDRISNHAQIEDINDPNYLSVAQLEENLLELKNKNLISYFEGADPYSSICFGVDLTKHIEEKKIAEDKNEKINITKVSAAPSQFRGKYLKFKKGDEIPYDDYIKILGIHHKIFKIPFDKAFAFVQENEKKKIDKPYSLSSHNCLTWAKDALFGLGITLQSKRWLSLFNSPTNYAVAIDTLYDRSEKFRKFADDCFNEDFT